nr:30S ribosomal protein S16 [Thermoanaerobacterium sp. R66]
MALKGGDKVAVRIRLKRMGAKKSPFYRFVVADSRSPRDGKFIEEIGYYNPVSNPKEIKIDSEKAIKWLKVGAQPSDTVRALFKKEGIFDKINN